MPYIKQEDRVRMLLELVEGNAPTCNTPGELNYFITCLIHTYWDNNGRNYQAFNDIIGALEACKLELYRRRVAPYEDTKIEENGDV